MKKEGFKIIQGENPIIISAPHSVEHTRGVSIKFAEKQTKEILDSLCFKTSCYGIFKTANLDDDANFDEISAYKSFLIDFIKTNKITCLIDLHQMAPWRVQEIDIGTGLGKNIFNNSHALGKMVGFFKEQKFKVSIDSLFCASNKNTVSATISRICLIPSFQIEINSKLLISDFNEYRFSDIVASIEKFIDYMKKNN